MDKCQKCGYENDMDATFCEKCGAKLTSSFSTIAPSKPIRKEESMAKSTKILIVVCVILIAGLGISIGVLMQMNKGEGTVIVNNSTVTQSPTQVSNQESWHEIASFSGANNGTGDFVTQGNMFKIVMTANPQLNFNTNSMTVDVSDSNDNVIGSGNIQWAPTEAISQKEKTIEIKDTPGTYSVAETTYAIQNWTVDVYDYY